MIDFSNTLGYHVCSMQNLEEKKVIFSVNNKIVVTITKDGKIKILNDSLTYKIESNEYLIFIISKNTNTLFFNKNNKDKYEVKFTENKLDILNENFDNLKKYVIPSKIDKNMFNNIRSNIKFKNNYEKYKYGLLRFIISKSYSTNVEELEYNLLYNDIYEICWREKKGLDAIILAGDDWSNTAHRFTKSYNINDKNVLLIKLNHHIFNYAEQGIIWKVQKRKISKYPVIWQLKNMNLLNLIMNNVNKVILHATAIFALDSKLIFDYFPNKEYIFCHGGTSYREAPQNIRFLDNIVKKYIIQCPDLLGYSPTHITEKLIYYPIEIKKIKPNFNFRQGVNVLTIGHWPSTKSVKGTAVILDTLRQLYSRGFKFKYVGVTSLQEKWQGSKDFVPWEENIKRMQNIDIYIETINLQINGKKFGEWGNTCLEAAACGAVVCTNCLEHKKYEKEYKTKLPLMVSNSGTELYNNLKKLLLMNRKDVLDLKKRTRKWCEDYHSIEKTGKRLIEYVF